MKMLFETLTPVHVGSGEKYGPMESYVEGNIIKRVNLDSLFNLDPSVLKNYVNALDNKNVTELNNILKRGKLRYSAKLKNGVSITKMEDTIREFIKDSAGDVPYIPGSTLKGFIRTALIVKYLKDNGWNFEVSIRGRLKSYNIWKLMQYGDREHGIRPLLQDWEDVKNNRVQKTIGARFENLVVYVGDVKGSRYDAKYDIFKYLEVSDFYPSSYEIFVDRAINYTNGRPGASLLIETVEGKFSGEISLSSQIKAALNDRNYPALRRKLSLLGLNESLMEDLEKAESKMIAHIQAAIREYINDILTFEKKREKIISHPEDANIRIGFGTGALYKTLWIYIVRELPDYLSSKLLYKFSRHRTSIHVYPKSYYLLSDRQPLGWGKLSKE